MLSQQQDPLHAWLTLPAWTGRGKGCEVWRCQPCFFSSSILNESWDDCTIISTCSKDGFCDQLNFKRKGFPLARKVCCLLLTVDLGVGYPAAVFVEDLYVSPLTPSPMAGQRKHHCQLHMTVSRDSLVAKRTHRAPRD